MFQPGTITVAGDPIKLEKDEPFFPGLLASRYESHQASEERFASVQREDQILLTKDRKYPCLMGYKDRVELGVCTQLLINVLPMFSDRCWCDVKHL